MLEIISGLIAGIISGLGMGGGVVLIICLALFLFVYQKIAQGANLIFFIPTAIAVSYFNSKHKMIHFKTATIIILTGIIGAIVGASITQRMDITHLKKTFGIFLCGITAHEIYRLIKEYKNLKKNHNKIKR